MLRQDDQMHDILSLAQKTGKRVDDEICTTLECDEIWFLACS